MNAHGTTARYRSGCRCDDCRRANTRYDQYRRLDMLRGIERTVDVTGTRRRVQALHCHGYSLAMVAEAAGYRSLQAISRAINRTRVTVATRDRIAAAFDALMAEPGPSRASRQRAARMGFSPAHAWLNIDDPNETPDPGYQSHRSRRDRYVDPVVVERILGGDFTLAATTTKAEKVEVVAWWRELGRPLNELERETGWEPRKYLMRESA